jgi:D-alanyl-D-alanine carboxypeptidase
MKNKVQFMLIEMVLLAFFILLSAVVLNGSSDSETKQNTLNLTSDLDNSQTESIVSNSSDSNETSSDVLSEIETSSEPPVNISDWNMILVNQTHPLEAEWINSVKTKALPNGLEVDERIYDSLTQMLDDAEANGYPLIVCSAYRTYEKQEELFENRLQRYLDAGLSQQEAYEKSQTSVLLPGTSEHHTGLAVDIVAHSYQNLDDGMLVTPEIQWLYQNCQNYGFIVRYPNGKSDITGIIHEPWHYRYVGVEAAKEIMSKGICLEEYLGMTD